MKFMKTIFWLAVFLCSTHISAQKNYSIASINKELMEYSNSIVVDELVEIDVTDINKMRTKTHRVMAVLNKMGDQDTNIREFYDSNTKLKNIETRNYNVLERQIPRYRNKDYNDVSRTGNNMYADSRVLFLKYTPTTDPYIVVYTSETETGYSA